MNSIKDERADPRPKVPCTWCFYGSRREWVAATHVVLFACIREHMSARPICDLCACGRAAVGDPFICKECAAAGESDDNAVCEITLITTRDDWMGQIGAGRIRMLVRP